MSTLARDKLSSETRPKTWWRRGACPWHLLNNCVNETYQNSSRRFINFSTMVLPPPHHTVSSSVSAAAHARDSLTVKEDNKHHAKVCCICDCFIQHGEEAFLSFEDLQKSDVKDVLGKKPITGLTARATGTIHNYYRPTCLSPRCAEMRFLGKLYLSPRSYKRKPSNKPGFGCCIACRRNIKGLSNQKSLPLKPPERAIANGLMIGPVPQELQCLSHVEIAMISIARVDKHVFSYEGGAHQQMKGWHSMYANDIEAVSRTVNWAADHLSDDSNDSLDGNENRPVEDYDSDDSSENEQEIFEANNNGRKRFGAICVILSGPFTHEQLSIARERTKVDFDRVKKALRWLKNNNVQYRNYDINDDLAEPIFLEQIEQVESVNSNIEKSVEFCAVFPDSSHPDSLNGGFATRKGFKECTLERMLTKSKDRDATLISRPTRNLLRDYEGDNLLKAFPLQFPYGIGSRTRNDEDEFHSGKMLWPHLTRMSACTFHRPDFVCVLHNMFERLHMRSSSTFHRRWNDAENYVNVTNEAIHEAAERLHNGASGSSTADKLLKSMSAATREMAHTNAACKEARQRLYAMCAAHGVPSMMVTVTPNDEYNFRIRVMVNPMGENGPPPETASNERLREFFGECTKWRRQYPGICALDYENVMRIFVRHYIGWDTEENKNIEGEGIFGDVVAWSIATEEQGRKTLHGHSLIWLKEWPELHERLISNDDAIRQSASQQVATYVDRIQTTHIIARDDLNFKRPCDASCPSNGDTHMAHHMELIQDQDVRNLRCTKGTTSIGSRCIMKCQDCNMPYTSEDLAVTKVIDYFGLERVLDEGMRPCVSFGFWTRNMHVSNAFLRMERQIMKSLMPQPDTRIPSTPYLLDEKTRFCIATTRNLHKSDHVKKCFKSKKSVECRMKLPCRAARVTKIHFRDKNVPWYSWNGRKRERSLYFIEQKRSNADLFGNIHSPAISNVFGCNTNVAACVDGGSPMYLTNYTSKNTQEEDSAAVANAAKHIIRNLQRSLQAHGQLFGDESLADTVNRLTPEERKQRGLKALMGAVIMSTRAHVCSAPMGAFLIRNESRFMYSHEGAYTNLHQFERHTGSDMGLGSDQDGTVYLTSTVANYIHRPLVLENICLYDFLADYDVKRRCKDSLPWHGNHPSGEYRKVKPRKFRAIPRINHYDFPSTVDFEGEDIRTCSIPEDKKAFHYAMENYAKRVCIVFVPFRDLSNDLKIDNSYHKKLQSVFREGRFLAKHERILQNMQDIRNSLNAGRVDDALEADTVFKYKKEYDLGEGDDDDENTNNDTSEIMDDLLGANADFTNICYPKYRSENGTFAFESRISRELGQNKCGEKDLITPPVPHSAQFISRNATSPEEQNNTSAPMEFDNAVNGHTLNMLSVHVRERIIDVDQNGQEFDVPDATGTIENLVEYSKALFKEDREQRHAFVTASAAFCLRIHMEALKHRDNMQRTDVVRLERKRKKLLVRVRTGQLIAFLNGPGGTGKSHVVAAIVRYCKRLCENLNVNFDRRTIVVTAMSGSAAVSINGETAHMACCINKKAAIPQQEIERWKHAYLLIIDEISFASKSFIEKLNKRLGQLLQNPGSKFGGIHILFVGDMSQLDPVGQKAMYKEEDISIWHGWVHTFLELKTNHRFKEDPSYGACMARMRNEGPTTEDVEYLNSRLIGSENGPSADEIPSDVTYATASNHDRVAINDGIFAQHLIRTHSQTVEIR